MSGKETRNSTQVKALTGSTQEVEEIFEGLRSAEEGSDEWKDYRNNLESYLKDNLEAPYGGTVSYIVDAVEGEHYDVAKHRTEHHIGGNL